MTDTSDSLDINCDVTKRLDNINLQTEIVHPLCNNNEVDDCEAAEETVTTNSVEYLSAPLRYQSFEYSTSSNASSDTIQPSTLEEHDNLTICSDYNFNNLQIPIVGYEVMEERAKFTVYKLRIENKASGDCWYVFRRYTDFVRLCSKIRHSFPHVAQHLPRKRWLGNNFDTVFLEERVNGLQTLVNSVLNDADLVKTQLIQEFFCLNEPPVYSETNEESRAMFEALEDTIYQMKQQLQEKDTFIDSLEESLHSKTIENDNLKKIIKSSTPSCQKCQKDYANISKMFQ